MPLKTSILFFLFLLLGLLFSSCDDELEAVSQDIQKEMVAREVARDVELLYSDSAIVRVRVKGPTMTRHLDRGDPKQEFPDGVSIDFLAPSGNTQSFLSAKYAMRKENKDEVIIQDSVVWNSKQGEKLETEELIWDNKKRTMKSNKFVKITKPGEVVYGYGFEANEDFTVWKIKAMEGIMKVEGFEDLQ